VYPRELRSRSNADRVSEGSVVGPWRTASKGSFPPSFGCEAEKSGNFAYGVKVVPLSVRMI
jgi:hypothetical protein